MISVKYIALIRGNEEIWYPMFEVKSEYIDNGLFWNPFTSQGSSVSGAVSGGSIPDTIQVSLDNIFNDSIPTHASDFGSIIQTEDMFEQDPDRGGNWLKRASGDYIEIPIGEKPEDWDTNYFDYCIITQDNYFQMWVYSVIVGDSTIEVPPTWDSSTQYYKNNTSDLRERFNHLFKTDAGYTFGIWTGTGTGYAGYNKHYSRLGTNPGNLQFNTGDRVYWRDRNGDVIDFTGLSSYRINWYTALTLMDLSPDGESEYSTIPLTNESRTYYIFVYVTYRDTTYYGIANIGLNSGGAPVNIRMILFDENLWGADSISDYSPEQEPQGGEWGDSTTRRGGNGTFSAPSDNRGDSSGTYLTNYETSMRNALNDGFNNGGVKIYQIAGQYAGDVIGVLFGADYFDKFLNSMYNPLSAILSYHMIPSSLRGDAFANSIPLTAGGFNISAKMTTPTNFPQINSVKKLHVGSIDIANYFGAFPDFAPHTQAILHLPYIGDITIDINAIMYGTLSVDYFCDNVSGNVAAWIWCSDRDGKCTYKYIVTGNCAYTIPLYSQSQNGGAVGKIMSSGVSLVGGLLSGNAAGAVGGAIGIAGGLFDAATTPRNTQTTGGNSGNVSMLGDSVVWLEIIRPQWVNPENYQSQSGIPSQISGKISDFRGGFFQVETVDLENVPATDTEIAELEQMLKDGIYYLNE